MNFVASCPDGAEKALQLKLPHLSIEDGLLERKILSKQTEQLGNEVRMRIVASEGQ